MNTLFSEPQREDVETILRHYNLRTTSASLSYRKLSSGTKNQNFILQLSSNQKYFLRMRHPSFCDAASIQFDHELMLHLNQKGVRAPCPVRTPSGCTWLEYEGRFFELFPFIDAPDSYHQHDLEQLINAGKALGQFHTAVRDFNPGVSKKKFRIDPPARAETRVNQLMKAAKNRADLACGEYILKQIRLVKTSLPDELFFELPSLTVHGDFHPANVKYIGKEVAGFFDLDWASMQPRIYDVSYGLLYFAALRLSDIDGGNIYSLTQTCTPDIERFILFLKAYLKYVALNELEIEMLPVMMRINWICCRTDGSFKVPENEQYHYFSTGIMQPLIWLDENETRLIKAIKEIM